MKTLIRFFLSVALLLAVVFAFASELVRRDAEADLAAETAFTIKANRDLEEITDPCHSELCRELRKTRYQMEDKR